MIPLSSALAEANFRIVGYIRTVPVPLRAKRVVDEWTTAAGIGGGAIFRRVSRLGKICGGHASAGRGSRITKSLRLRILKAVGMMSNALHSFYFEACAASSTACFFRGKPGSASRQSLSSGASALSASCLLPRASKSLVNARRASTQRCCGSQETRRHPLLVKSFSYHAMAWSVLLAFSFARASASMEIETTDPPYRTSCKSKSLRAPDASPSASKISPCNRRM